MSLGNYTSQLCLEHNAVPPGGFLALKKGQGHILVLAGFGNSAQLKERVSGGQ